MPVSNVLARRERACRVLMGDTISHLLVMPVMLLPGRMILIRSNCANQSEMFKFEVPSLTVGTLDTLMTLSDELVKTDNIVEQTVRKIEKTTAELFDRKSADLTVGGELHLIYYVVAASWFMFKYIISIFYPVRRV